MQQLAKLKALFFLIPALSKKSDGGDEIDLAGQNYVFLDFVEVAVVCFLQNLVVVPVAGQVLRSLVLFLAAVAAVAAVVRQWDASVLLAVAGIVAILF